MNYSLISIDGISLKQLWENNKMRILTQGQIDLMLNQINLQQQGFGTFRSDYQKYWDNPPGTPVTTKP